MMRDTFTIHKLDNVNV